MEQQTNDEKQNLQEVKAETETLKENNKTCDSELFNTNVVENNSNSVPQNGESGNAVAKSSWQTFYNQYKKPIWIVSGILVVVILLLIIIPNATTNYGSPATYHSGNNKIVSFDGNGNCMYAGMACSYVIKGDKYIITSSNGGTVTLDIVKDGVLINKAKSGGKINIDKRSGYVNTSFGGRGEEYTLYGDGSFILNSSDNLWLASGEYYLNDGVLILKHTRSLTQDWSISMKVWYTYMYIDNSGNSYAVLLSDPSYYEQNHV